MGNGTYEFTFDLHKVTAKMEAVYENNKKNFCEDGLMNRKTSSEDTVNVSEIYNVCSLHT